MKSFWILVVVIALVLFGLFLILTQPRSVEQEALVEEATAPIAVAEGTVTHIDRSPMMVDGPGLVTIVSTAGARNVIAVPSMGRLLCASASAVTDAYAIEEGDSVSVRGDRNAEGQIVPCEAGHYLKVRSQYVDPMNLFSFSYEKGPSGYVLEESEETLGDDVVVALTLTETEEFEAMQNTDIVREGPATIQIHVFKNPLAYSPSLWVDRNPSVSGKDRILSSIEETILGGVHAVRYRVDGLYAADTLVAAHGEYIYMLTGMYIHEESKMYSDFLALIDSFTFSAPVE